MHDFQYKFGDRPLEGYTIQRGVGHGGFGEVYYALSDSGREVALKVVQSHEQIELRGIRQCMNLKSPHLVTVFDVKHSESGKPFVIMEYVAGPSLRDLLDQSPGGMGAQKAAFLLREIAKGLTYLHDRGIVHRDLKPGNIFYEDGYVKIGDYGLSKAISASQHSGQTITVGTVHYMAPEIGQGRYDREIDIYALGVILYEMLAGRVPFFGATPGEVLMKHMAGELDLSGIDESFAPIIRRAMEKDPDKRFQSAQEMVEAIFGTEHIRESVSHFRPESLSVAAERATEKVGVAAGTARPAGLPGSSADQAITPGVSQAGGAGSSNAWEDNAGDWSDVGKRWGQWGWDYGQRMGDWGRRMGEWGRRIGQQGSQAAGPMPPMPGLRVPTPPDEECDEAIADAKRDPLGRGQRRALGLLTAAMVAVGIGTIWPIRRPPGAGVLTAFMAFWAIFGAVCGIAFARYRLKVKSESSLIDRLAYGGSASVFLLLLAAPVALLNGMVSGFPRALNDSILPILVSVFLVNWRKRSSPARAERISLGSAFTAGLMGFIIAAICDGSMELTAALLAGISLAAQISFPFDPEAFPRWRSLHPKPQAPPQRPAAGAAGAQPPPPPPPPPPPVGDARTPISPERWYAAAVRSTSSSRGDLPVPGFVRGLALAAFSLLLGGGLATLIWGGMARLSNDDTAIAISLGCGFLLLSFFCMLKAIQTTYRSWWSSLVKPLLMLGCIETVIASSMCLGFMRLSSDEELAAILLIVLPAIFFIVIAAIPNSFIHHVTGSVARLTPPRPNQPADTPGQSPLTWPAGVSARSRSVALITACLGFIGFAGIHRFYVGKIGTGILWLCTGGLLYIGTICDVVKIAVGRFRDRHGLSLLVWDPEEELWRRSATHTQPAANQPPSVTPTQPMYEPFRPAAMLLSAMGGLALLVAILLGLALALRLPEAAVAGLPDPGLARELEKEFGYPQWPGLVERIGVLLMGTFAFISAAMLVAARRHDGAKHVSRAIVGIIGVVVAVCPLLHETFANVCWQTVAALVNDRKGAMALESVLNSVNTTGAVIGGMVLLISIILLSWPAHRHQDLPTTPVL